MPSDPFVKRILLGMKKFPNFIASGMKTSTQARSSFNSSYRIIVTTLWERKGRTLQWILAKSMFFWEKLKWRRKKQLLLNRTKLFLWSWKRKENPMKMFLFKFPPLSYLQSFLLSNNPTLIPLNLTKSFPLSFLLFGTGILLPFPSRECGEVTRFEGN